jgi:hypothetical protein
LYALPRISDKGHISYLIISILHSNHVLLGKSSVDNLNRLDGGRSEGALDISIAVDDRFDLLLLGRVNSNSLLSKVDWLLFSYWGR